MSYVLQIFPKLNRAAHYKQQKQCSVFMISTYWFITSLYLVKFPLAALLSMIKQLVSDILQSFKVPLPYHTMSFSTTFQNVVLNST